MFSSSLPFYFCYFHHFGIFRHSSHFRHYRHFLHFHNFLSDFPAIFPFFFIQFFTIFTSHLSSQWSCQKRSPLTSRSSATFVMTFLGPALLAKGVNRLAITCCIGGAIEWAGRNVPGQKDFATMPEPGERQLNVEGKRILRLASAASCFYRKQAGTASSKAERRECSDSPSNTRQWK